MMRLLKGIWRVLSGISRVITVWRRWFLWRFLSSPLARVSVTRRQSRYLKRRHY